MSVRRFAPVFLAVATLALVAAEGTAHAEGWTHCRLGGAVGFDTGRLGIGGAVGHEFQVDQRDGDQVSLLAQFRLTRRLTVEGELGKTEYHDSNDVDRRAGAALAFQVGRLAFLSPYVLVGGGQVGADGESDPYLEGGAGVKFPISRNFVLMLDVRTGQRYGDEAEDGDRLLSAAGTPDVGGNDDARGTDYGYSRWRLVGMVFF